MKNMGEEILRFLREINALTSEHYLRAMYLVPITTRAYENEVRGITMTQFFRN